MTSDTPLPLFVAIMAAGNLLIVDGPSQRDMCAAVSGRTADVRLRNCRRHQGRLQGLPTADFLAEPGYLVAVRAVADARLDPGRGGLDKTWAVCLALAVFIALIAWSASMPVRGIPDRIAGTYPVLR